MTNNEAAKWIQLYIDLAKFDPLTGEAAYLNDDDRKTIEAMEMAINALTAQPETHDKRTEMHACDLIDRRALMKEFSDFVRASNNSDFAPKPTWNDAVSLVGSMPSAQPSSSCAHENDQDLQSTCNKLATDCISRQAAIDAVNKNRDPVFHDSVHYEDAVYDISKLPSAQPEPPEPEELDFAQPHKKVGVLLEIGQPEIIRCKECKHQIKEWRTDKRRKDNGYMVCGCEVVGDACGYWALLGQDDDYCSMAERRTDEADYRKE